jgi:hypothetical protein
MMIRWILSWFGGGVLDRLVQIYAKNKDSQVESERIRADVAMNQLDNYLENQKLATRVRLSTAGFWEMRVLTFFIAAPFVVHLNLVALDTCFKLGWRIPAFPPPFDVWEGSILLSFFGLSAAMKLGAMGLSALRR